VFAIIKVDCQFNQTQHQKTGIKVDIFLGSNAMAVKGYFKDALLAPSFMNGKCLSIKV
jgi:hypothetical protein